AHLGLLLVGDHVRRLFGEAAVLLLRLLDGLLQLDLGIGRLLELHAEGGPEVAPCTAQRLEHGPDATAPPYPSPPRPSPPAPGAGPRARRPGNRRRRPAAQRPRRCRRGRPAPPLGRLPRRAG